jgi:hypothetical protein
MEKKNRKYSEKNINTAKKTVSSVNRRKNFKFI